MAAYDYGTLKTTTQVDPNDATTDWLYNDSFDRVTQVRRAAGSGSETQSNTSYATNKIVTAQDQNSKGDGVLKSQTLYDGLGCAIESDVFESASQYIATTQSYDALGRVVSATNPSRPGDGLNAVTTYQYDALGRVLQVQTADGAKALTSYYGSGTTYTDQAGKQRFTTTDALGRIGQVVEDPGSSPHLNYVTTYAHDALDNLTKVTQGSQTRTFAYDPRGLLLQAVNPESGTVTYP